MSWDTKAAALCPNSADAQISLGKELSSGEKNQLLKCSCILDKSIKKLYSSTFLRS